MRIRLNFSTSNNIYLSILFGSIPMHKNDIVSEVYDSDGSAFCCGAVSIFFDQYWGLKDLSLEILTSMLFLDHDLGGTPRRMNRSQTI